MTARKTPGRRLIDELNSALPPCVVWTRIEHTTIATIEVMADRLAVLRRRTDTALADPETPPAQVAVLANATRCLEVSMHGLIKSLDPEMVGQAKSVRHQHAAMTAGMAQLADPDADSALRAYLLEQARDLRRGLRRDPAR